MSNENKDLSEVSSLCDGDASGQELLRYLRIKNRGVKIDRLFSDRERRISIRVELTKPTSKEQEREVENHAESQNSENITNTTESVPVVLRQQNSNPLCAENILLTEDSLPSRPHITENVVISPATSPSRSPPAPQTPKSSLLRRRVCSADRLRRLSFKHLMGNGARRVLLNELNGTEESSHFSQFEPGLQNLQACTSTPVTSNASSGKIGTIVTRQRSADALRNVAATLGHSSREYRIQKGPEKGQIILTPSHLATYQNGVQDKAAQQRTKTIENMSFKNADPNLSSNVRVIIDCPSNSKYITDDEDENDENCGTKETNPETTIVAQQQNHANADTAKIISNLTFIRPRTPIHKNVTRSKSIAQRDTLLLSDLETSVVSNSSNYDAPAEMVNEENSLSHAVTTLPIVIQTKIQTEVFDDAANLSEVSFASQATESSNQIRNRTRRVKKNTPDHIKDYKNATKTLKIKPKKFYENKSKRSLYSKYTENSKQSSSCSYDETSKRNQNKSNFKSVENGNKNPSPRRGRSSSKRQRTPSSSSSSNDQSSVEREAPATVSSSFTYCPSKPAEKVQSPVKTVDQILLRHRSRSASIRKPTSSESSEENVSTSSTHSVLSQLNKEASPQYKKQNADVLGKSLVSDSSQKTENENQIAQPSLSPKQSLSKRRIQSKSKAPTFEKPKNKVNSKAKVSPMAPPPLRVSSPKSTHEPLPVTKAKNAKRKRLLASKPESPHRRSQRERKPRKVEQYAIELYTRAYFPERLLKQSKGDIKIQKAKKRKNNEGSNQKKNLQPKVKIKRLKLNDNSGNISPAGNTIVGPQNAIVSWLESMTSNTLANDTNVHQYDRHFLSRELLVGENLKDIEFRFYNHQSNDRSLGYIIFKPKAVKKMIVLKHSGIKFICIHGRFKFKIIEKDSTEIKEYCCKVADAFIVDVGDKYGIENLSETESGQLMIIKEDTMNN